MPEIQQWMSSTGVLLGDVCSIVAESKMNTGQKKDITNTCRKIELGTPQMAGLYQSLRQKSILAHNVDLRQYQDIATPLNHF